MITAAQAAVLSELGIVAWRARAGQAFPGAGDLAVAETVQETGAPEPALTVEPTVEPRLDLCLYASTASEAEAELLARILHAVQGLRGDLRLQHLVLNAPQPLAYAHLCLDDADLPSPATMLADVSSKRRVWQVLQDTVARLP
jgi:hypothetical protein